MGRSELAYDLLDRMRDNPAGNWTIGDVERLCRRPQAVQTDALNGEPALLRSLGHHTHGAKRGECAQNVFALEQAVDVGHTFSERAQHHRSM